MCCRALLAAIAVTCMFTRIHALGPQRLDPTKDLLCVLILNGLQKEDLDESTLQKLRRRNVNIDDLNNEALLTECVAFELSKTKPLNTIKKTNGTYNVAEIRTQNESQLYFVNNNDKENKTKGESSNELEPNRNISTAMDTNKENKLDKQEYNCNKPIKYDNLNSMMEFWKKCIYGKKQINYQNSIKVKEVNEPRSNKSPINTFSTNYIHNQTPIRKKITKDMEQISKSNKENVFEHVKNQNLIKEYQNNQIMSDDPLMPNLYTTLNNNDRSDTSKRGNMEERSEEQGKGFLRRGYGDTFRKESVQELSIAKTIPYNPNNVVYSENLPSKDSYRQIVTVNGSPKFIPNIVLLDNKLFFPKNEPNKYLQARELLNTKELMKMRDGNLFYPINIPNTDIYMKKPFQIQNSYVTVPKISNNNYWYSENIPNKDLRTVSLLSADKSPIFIQTTAAKNVNNYNRYTPYNFRREPIKETYFPKIITYGHYNNLFYPEIESRRLIIQNQSTSVNDTVDKNIFHTKSYNTKNNLEEGIMFIPNTPIEGTTNKFNLLSEAKINDAIYKTTYDIPKENNSYPDHHLKTNVQSIQKNTVNSINLTKDKPINKRNVYNAKEPTKFLDSKETLNVDKSVKVHNQQTGVVFNHENDEALLKKETDKKENISKTRLDIVKSSFLSSKITPLDKRTDETKDSSKSLEGVTNSAKELLNQNFTPAKSQYNSESVKEEESKMITSKSTTTKPNTLSVSKQPVDNGLPNVIPKNIIIDIAESIKEYVLKDLKKQFTVAPTTITPNVTAIPFSTTTTTQKIISSTTTTTTTGNTQNIMKSNESAIQDAVWAKVFKMLQQMNIFKNNTLEGNHKTSTTTPPTTIASRKFNIKEKHTTTHKKMSRALTFQTNLLDIPPLNFYMDRYLDPVNQNIVLPQGKVQTPLRDIMATNNSSRKELRDTDTITPHQGPSQEAAVNADIENFGAMINSDTNNAHINKDVNIETHTDPAPNIASQYYTYNRPVNTDVSMEKVSANEAPLVLDRQRCCNRQYVSQLMRDCCRERFETRQQVSLHRPNYRAESRIKTLIRTHKKVNSMLENILASRNKYTQFRSVENI